MGVSKKAPFTQATLGARVGCLRRLELRRCAHGRYRNSNGPLNRVDRLGVQIEGERHIGKKMSNWAGIETWTSSLPPRGGIAERCVAQAARVKKDVDGDAATLQQSRNQYASCIGNVFRQYETEHRQVQHMIDSLVLLASIAVPLILLLSFHRLFCRFVEDAVVDISVAAIKSKRSAIRYLEHLKGRIDAKSNSDKTPD